MVTRRGHIRLSQPQLDRKKASLRPCCHVPHEVSNILDGLVTLATLVALWALFPSSLQVRCSQPGLSHLPSAPCLFTQTALDIQMLSHRLTPVHRVSPRIRPAAACKMSHQSCRLLITTINHPCKIILVLARVIKYIYIYIVLLNSAAFPISLSCTCENFPNMASTASRTGEQLASKKRFRAMPPAQSKLSLHNHLTFLSIRDKRWGLAGYSTSRTHSRAMATGMPRPVFHSPLRGSRATAAEGTRCGPRPRGAPPFRRADWNSKSGWPSL